MTKFDPQSDQNANEAPSNWTPESDADARWEAILKLVVEAASRMRIPPPVVFERMYKEILEELVGDLESDTKWQGLASLLKEADQPKNLSQEQETALRELLLKTESKTTSAEVISVQPTTSQTDESFGKWVSSVFTGGGVPASLVRLAAVGVLTFYLGSTLRDGGEVGGTQVASGPNGPPVVAQHANVPLNYSPSDVVEVVTTPPPPSGQIVPVASQNLPNMVTRGEVGWEDVNPANRETVLYKSDRDAEQIVDVPQSWYIRSFQPQGAVPVSTSAVAANQRVVDLVQQVRLEAGVERDELLLEKVRQLEEAITPLLKQGGEPADAQAQALNELRKGEQLLRNGNVQQAMDRFIQVERIAPDTTLAFSARFYQARVNYEVFQDFAQSLEDYRSLIEDFPDRFLSAKHREHISARIDLLTFNHEDNWKALRLWVAADNASGQAQVDPLVQIIRETPRSPLAGDSAMHLANLALDGAFEGKGEIAALLDLYTSALGSIGVSPESDAESGDFSTASAHAAAIQFAKGEVVYQFMMDPDWARREFEKVIALPQNDHYAGRARIRISAINRIQ